MTRKNLLLDKINHILSITASDENTALSLFSHLEASWKYIYCNGPPKFNTQSDYVEALASKFFFAHIENIYPKTSFTCKPEEKFEWPIPLYPSEAFRKIISEKRRRANFFELLKMTDVLDCKVIGIQHSEIHLIVVHKLGCNRLLEDLNIKLLLPRSRRELAFLEGQTLSNKDFLRVVVSQITQTDGKENGIKVTLDKNVLHDPNNSTKLGKIWTEDLPIYVRYPHGVDIYKTMKNYLDSQEVFNIPKYVKNIFACFGLDPYRMYGFVPIELHSWTNDHRTMRIRQQIKHHFQEYVKERKIKEIEMHCLKASVLLSESQFSEALNEVNKAIKKDPQCCKAYEIRIEIYEKIEGKFGKQTMYDISMVYRLDKDNMKNRERCARILSVVANKKLQRKDYASARTVAEKSLLINPDQKGALELIRYLKRHHRVEAFGEKERMEVDQIVPIKRIKQEPV